MKCVALLACLVAACSDPSHGPSGGDDGGSGDDAGLPPDASLCAPACTDEPNADVTCTAFAACESSCKLGFARCGDSCTAESPTQCGIACEPCPGSTHGAATCTGGVCGLACDPGFTPCRDGLAMACCAFASEVAAPQELGGYQAQLAIDAAGKLHLAYWRAAEHQLMYATDKSGAWAREPANVYWSEDGGEARFQIAVGAHGPLMLVSRPFIDSKLTFSERRDNGWSTSTLVDELPAGFAMVADRAGRAHACLTRSTNHPGVRYAIRRGDRWTITQITDDPEARGACAIAVDAQGLPHIAYYKADAKDVAYAHGDAAGAFTFATVDSAGDVGSELAIAVDAQGAPHLAAWRADVYTLRYATLAGGAWKLESAGPGRIGRRPSIAVDQSGAPVIAYFGEDRYRVSVTSRIGGVWTPHVFESVDRENGAVAVAPNGNVYVATGSNDIAIHVRTATTWADVPVDRNDDTGYEVTLLHRAGQPILVYRKSSNFGSAPVIEVATRAGGAWTYADVPGGGTAPTAALDASGTVHIAYTTGLDLAYAVQTPAGFTVEPLAAGAYDASLALDGAGTPHAVYVTTAGGLLHAVRGTAGWSATPIDATPGHFQRPVLRIAGSTLHLLWYDPIAKQTIYASSADGFAKVVLEPTAAAGHDLMLAGAVPHACLFRRPASSGFPELRYATRPAATWSTVVVPPPGTAVNDDVCALASDGTAIAIGRSLRYGAGFGELVLTVLGTPNVHTIVKDDFYSATIGVGVGAGGFELGATGEPYHGGGLDQIRVRWSHR